ncbi:MAG: hypothetical protein ACJ789_12780 [Thermomicrobiales bacterium]
MSASRFLHAGFIGLTAWLLAMFTSSALTFSSPNAHGASAQQASDLTISLTSSTTKAKIGDFVAFTAVVENTGTASVTDLLINLNLPDALNARAINCPGETSGSTTFCVIGDLPAGSVAEILFVVQVGTKQNNGPVTVSASIQSLVVATDSVPALKIVGPTHG